MKILILLMTITLNVYADKTYCPDEQVILCITYPEMEEQCRCAVQEEELNELELLTFWDTEEE